MTWDPGMLTLRLLGAGGRKPEPFTVMVVAGLHTGALLGVMDEIVGGDRAVIWILSLGEMVLPHTSKICTWKGKFPIVDGVPVMVEPSLENTRPFGRIPVIRRSWKGPLPPLK